MASSQSQSSAAGTAAGSSNLEADLSALSLAMPSLNPSGSGASAAVATGPFSPFHAAANPFTDVSGDGVVDANTFRDADNEVYRSLGHDGLSDAPVFRSVGHMSGSSSQFEDMSSFSAHASSSSSASSSSLQQPSLSITANPFQPISLSSELNAAHSLGFGKAKPSAAAAAVPVGSLNPKHASFVDVSAVDASSAGDVLPPEVPGYLEPSYHFALSPSIRAFDFFGVLFPLLATLRVDFSPPVLEADRACKVKCVAYGAGASAGVGRVPFVVSLFRLDKNGNRLVVEFQRRSGCVMQFSQIYRRVKTDLQQKGVLLAAPSLAGAAGAALSRFTDCTVMPIPADLPKIENAHVSSAAAKKSVDLLLEMVNSEFTDVKMKAISMLSELTADTVYGDALAGAADSKTSTSTGVSSVLKCLQHSNEDVQRCAITILGNLTASTKRSALCSTLLNSTAAFGAVSAVLAASPNAANAQIIREAARAVANIVDTVGTARGGVEVSIVKAAIDSLSASTDATARFYADRLTNSLNGGSTAAASAPASGKALPTELAVPSLAFAARPAAN